MITSSALPKSKITSCIIGAKYTDEITELTQLGIECVTISPSANLCEEINCHADILTFKCGDGVLIADERTAGELRQKITDFTVLTCEKIFSPYPNDVKLNVAFTEKHIICNKNYASKQLAEFSRNNNIEIIHTKQGYSKCSLCIVDYNAVITEDEGLACLLKKYQYDVLKIEPGYIGLSKEHYGFFGGATAKLSPDIMYISGNLSEHPNYVEICGFLDKYGVRPVFNKNRHLNDFGGITVL